MGKVQHFRARPAVRLSTPFCLLKLAQRHAAACDMAHDGIELPRLVRSTDISARSTCATARPSRATHAIMHVKAGVRRQQVSWIRLGGRILAVPLQAPHELLGIHVQAGH